MWLGFFKECMVSLIFLGINLLSLSITFFWSHKDKDKALLDEYNSIFNDYLNDDIIDVKKNNPSVEKVHYLPHRPVIQTAKQLR